MASRLGHTPRRGEIWQYRFSEPDRSLQFVPHLRLPRRPRLVPFLKRERPEISILNLRYGSTEGDLATDSSKKAKASALDRARNPVGGCLPR